jgi:hypothetical protein
VSDMPLNASKWLPGIHDLLTTTPVNSIGYLEEPGQKSASNDQLKPEKTDVVNNPQHIIHKAVAWKKMLDDGEVGSLSEIVENERLTGVRVTHIMNLL